MAGYNIEGLGSEFLYKRNRGYVWLSLVKVLGLAAIRFSLIAELTGCPGLINFS